MYRGRLMLDSATQEISLLRIYFTIKTDYRSSYSGLFFFQDVSIFYFKDFRYKRDLPQLYTKLVG
jgi:hypothetical protein